MRRVKADLEGALEDFNEAIRLTPEYHTAFNNRGLLLRTKGDREGVLGDLTRPSALPDYAIGFSNRGLVRSGKGDLEGALHDYNEAIRLTPDYADAFYNRAHLYKKKADPTAAVADLQKYLDEAGGLSVGDIEKVQRMIRDLESDRHFRKPSKTRAGWCRPTKVQRLTHGS